MKIVSATISPMPKSFFDAMPSVSVVFENGTKETLFEFYPDEIMFHPNEFVGLTREQARSLKFNKDRAYLQS